MSTKLNLVLSLLALHLKAAPNDFSQSVLISRIDPIQGQHLALIELHEVNVAKVI